MNNLRSALTAIFLGILFTVSVAAQAQTPPKIFLINTDAFYDEKGGVSKLIAANKQIETEFAAKVKDLDNGNARLGTIAKDLDVMRKLPPAQFNQVSFNAKQEEGASLQRSLNYQKTELETAVAKRRETLVTPISQDIGKGIDDFAKKNSYNVIFDVAKLAESGTLLFLAEGSDITKDFIAFYNARPATAAAPK